MGEGIVPLPFSFLDMKKIYKANTHVALNVILPNGKNTHVSFMGHSDGSSTLITTSEALQCGLEHHVHFGRLFYLDRVVADEEAKVERIPSSVGTTLREVSVSDLSDAKDYLAEQYGVSRTLLRSKSAIIEHGRVHGVVFTGI